MKTFIESEYPYQDRYFMDGEKRISSYLKQEISEILKIFKQSVTIDTHMDTNFEVYWDYSIKHVLSLSPDNLKIDHL